MHSHENVLVVQGQEIDGKHYRITDENLSIKTTWDDEFHQPIYFIYEDDKDAQDLLNRARVAYPDYNFHLKEVSLDMYA